MLGKYEKEQLKFALQFHSKVLETREKCKKLKEEGIIQDYKITAIHDVINVDIQPNQVVKFSPITIEIGSIAKEKKQ